MKYLKIITVSVLIISLLSCEKSIFDGEDPKPVTCLIYRFDIKNPDVDIFVGQLKNGTYNEYEKSETGENLWLKMPEFEKKHISKLIELAADTTHIRKFLTNPLSSRWPKPLGRDYFILGEGLLWIVEGIITGKQYPSLDPYLINTSLPKKDKYKGISAKEVLQIQRIYKKWWESNKHKDKAINSPLNNTVYRWF